MITPFIDIVKVDTDLPTPSYQSAGAAGIDLHSSHDGVVHSGEDAILSTGLLMAIPHGYKGTISGRSGMGFNAGIVPFMGTIDSDFRGELKIKLFNFSKKDYYFKRGDRVCQICIEPAPQAIIHEVKVLGETYRGSNGFASTGK